MNIMLSNENKTQRWYREEGICPRCDEIRVRRYYGFVNKTLYYCEYCEYIWKD
jgi:hypothetical protein